MSDSISYHEIKAVEWLNPAVYLVGFGIAAWAFHRCRKWGYLVLTVYFALASFSLLAMSFINRAISAHRQPTISEQTEKKIAAATQEAIHKVLAEEGHPEGVPRTHNVNFPLGQILLVAGLWLLASAKCPGPSRRRR